MSTADAVLPRPVLADLLPRGAVGDVALVVGAALLTALCAQIAVPLEPFSPVPITGQTFAVLLTGAALGARRGAAGQALYVLLGAVGLPFYSEGEGGIDVLVGTTGGYLVGFILAAAVVGWFAQRGMDRDVRTAAVAFLLGSIVIYAIGLPWLAVVADLSLSETLVAGLLPFIPGGLLKAALAAGLLPAAWRLTGR